MSPAFWCALFQPTVRRLGDFTHDNGIDFWLHTDGAINPLIDHFVEAGVKVLNPLEAKAGMDIVELRKRYGQELAFFGNIDATKMFASEEVIRAELERKVPLARDGGYIMHSDHSCPPEVGYDRYCWILRTAREIFDRA
jgi:uroporphyrinogen decarboxylase